MQRKSLSGLRSRLLKYLAEKKRISEKLLREYVDKLRSTIPRSTILLFGSRARGEQVPYSDYDIAVILEKVEDSIKIVENLRKLKPRGLNLDLIVLSVSDLEDPIIREMLKNSIKLHNGLHPNNLKTTSGNS